MIELATGAEARVTNPGGRKAVVCVNGGRGKEVPGTWASTLEWLVGRLGPEFPELSFVEVRYRIKSWTRLDWCVEDCRAAIELAAAEGADEVALLGFSLGGAVAITAADHRLVTTVIGLAPWIPDHLDVGSLHGRRLAIIHGALDRRLPGIPGVNPKSSLRAFERICDHEIEASYTIVPGGVHGVAVRSRRRGLVTLPRAGRWAELISAELERFERGPLDRADLVPIG